MKTYLIRSFVVVIVCALASITAFAAKVKKVQLTLADDVMVAGTLLKAGTYDFRFNHDTGELAIIRDGKVRATTTARLESRSDKAKYSAIRTRKTGTVTEFTGLVFNGQTEEVVVTSPAARR